MKSIKITIDGRTYNSLEEVPAELRGQYSDMLERAQSMIDRSDPFPADGSLARFGVEGPGDGQKHTFTTSTSSYSININGKTYERLEDIPEDVRRANPELMKNITLATYGHGLAPFNPDEVLPLNDFDELGDARERIKASLKNRPLEKDTKPVDTKNLIGTLAGIIALLLVAILVVLLMNG